jgi:hypothetical protein
MLDQDVLGHVPNMQSVIIPKPILPAFLRRELRVLGYPDPYMWLNTIIFARKSGQDLAAFYDTWENETDPSIHSNDAIQCRMIDAREKLLQIFTEYLNVSLLTSFLVHLDIMQIEEIEQGLILYYMVDMDQIDSTTLYGNLPYGYLAGTLVGH